MTISEEFRDFVLDQLDPALGVEARRMFGGYGLYAGGLFWGILHEESLWIWAEGELAEKLRNAGGQPFAPFADRSKTLRYINVTADTLENRSALNEIVLHSLQLKQKASCSKRNEPGRKHRKANSP